jgi:large subunit ribosomal protein L13
MKIYLDAKDMSLGRIGSFAVKKALIGDEVFILNCEEAIISGNKEEILEGITALRNKGGNSLKGPKIPRPAPRLLKRLIRGMLPWDRQRGRDAYKRIKCYGTNEFDSSKVEIFKIKSRLPLKYMKLKEVSRLI